MILILLVKGNHCALKNHRNERDLHDNDATAESPTSKKYIISIALGDTIFSATFHATQTKQGESMLR